MGFGVIRYGDDTCSGDAVPEYHGVAHHVTANYNF